jgi:hypothetical protein
MMDQPMRIGAGAGEDRGRGFGRMDDTVGQRERAGFGDGQVIGVSGRRAYDDGFRLRYLARRLQPGIDIGIVAERIEQPLRRERAGQHAPPLARIRPAGAHFATRRLEHIGKCAEPTRQHVLEPLAQRRGKA